LKTIRRATGRKASKTRRSSLDRMLEGTRFLIHASRQSDLENPELLSLRKDPMEPENNKGEPGACRDPL
jgi:hypothetical protein